MPNIITSRKVFLPFQLPCLLSSILFYRSGHHEYHGLPHPSFYMLLHLPLLFMSHLTNPASQQANQLHHLLPSCLSQQKTQVKKLKPVFAFSCIFIFLTRQSLCRVLVRALQVSWSIIRPSCKSCMKSRSLKVGLAFSLSFLDARLL